MDVDTINSAIYRDLVDKSWWRSPLVFAHVPPTAEKGALINELQKKWNFNLHVLEGPHEGNRNIENLLDSVVDGETILVNDFEKILDDHAVEQRLMKIRLKMSSTFPAESGVILLSTMSERSFPALPGSSPIDDAAKIHCSPMTRRQVRDLALEFGLASIAEVLHKKCGGVRRLLTLSISLEFSDASIRSKRRQFNESLRETIKESVAAADEDILQWLVEEFLEADSVNWLVPENENPKLVSQLLHSGLGTWHSELDGMVEVLPSDNTAMWMEEIRRHTLSTVAPSRDWQELSVILFTLERLLRRELWIAWNAAGSDRLKDRLENRRESILAMAESSLRFRPSDFSQLVNPLDWVTLETLFELCISEAHNAYGKKFLGLDGTQWEGLARDACPIRNRFAHMRLPHGADVATARAVLRKLNASA